MSETFKPTFKIKYLLVQDEFGKQNLHVQARDNFQVINERDLGNIDDIVALINENRKLKENWNELKKLLQNNFINAENIFNKINELEEKDK